MNWKIPQNDQDKDLRKHYEKVVIPKVEKLFPNINNFTQEEQDAIYHLVIELEATKMSNNSLDELVEWYSRLLNRAMKSWDHGREA
jgi:hypothetical protein